MTTPEKSARHILLIEDDAGIAQPLAYALGQQGWQVTWHTEGLKGLQTLSSQAIDFIILDIGLPDINGFDLCKKIRQTHHTPLLFLTAQSDEIDRILGLEIGADDYCAKPFSPREIISRIKAIWRRSEANGGASGDTAQTPQDISWDVWHFDAKTYVLSMGEQPIELSRSELQLMLALLASPTQVFSREQLLAHMSDHPEHRLPRTVDSHIKTIRQKIAQVSHADVIQTHRGIGYSLVAAQ